MRTAMTLLTLLLLGLLSALALGCGGGSRDATVPPGHDPQQAPDAPLWGTYELALDAQGTPAIRAIDARSGQLIVDPYVRVDLLATEFDPATRIWDIHARFTNTTRFTGFGLWTVFYNLNGNRILDQDGFTTPENGGDFPAAPGFGQRKPVIALGKDQERRRFVGGTSLEGHLRIQWPDGATNFNGLRFYLDASFPNARQHPIVENLTFAGNVVSALVIDWQSNPAPLQVHAVFPDSPLAVLFPMNDSGVAPDSTAGDNIWTGTTTAPAGPRIMVKATDSGGYHFENELGLQNTDPCPDGTGPGAFTPFLHGSHSNIRDAQEAIASNPAEWQQLWGFHAPGSAPPPVNFDCFNVYAAFMGERSTGGYSILPPLHLESSLLPELCYSTLSPAAACPVETVITAPFRMWLGPKLGAVAWKRSPRINECGTGNVFLHTLFQGTTPASQIGPIERVFRQPGEFAAYWTATQAPGLVPCVDFATESVVLVTQGTREREGHVARITSANADPAPAPGQPIDQLFIGWDAIAPGTGCETPAIVNTPVHFAVVPRVPEVTFTRTDRQATPCEPPNPVCEDSTLLIEDEHNYKEGTYRQLLVSATQYEAFWQEAFPNVPRPPVSFEQQSVIVIGLSNRDLDVDLECVKRVPNSAGGLILDVTYDIHGPGTNCPPYQNQYYIVAAINRFVGEVRWVANEVPGTPCEPPACEDYEVIVDRQLSYKDGPYRLLLNNRDAWEDFWQQAYPNEPPAPQINFETRSVLAISPGTVSLSPHTVAIECVRRPSTAQLVVEYTRTHPGPNCGTPGIWRPLLVVSIPKFAGNVEWVETLTTGTPCEPPDPCTDVRVLTDRAQAEQFQPGTVVLRNPNAYVEYWMSRYPGSQPPAVNFEQEMVLAINVGILAITRIPVIDCVRFGPAGSDDPIVVDWHREFWNAECPFEDGNWSIVVAIPRSERAVEFNQLDDTEYQCP